MRQSRSSTCKDHGKVGSAPWQSGVSTWSVPCPLNTPHPAVLTLALKLSLETGMFSGPPCTLKCLQPALALM